MEDARAAYELTKILIEHGHRRIGGIFKYDDMQGIERYKGFIQCLSDYGVKFDDDCVRWYSTKDMDEKLSKKGMLRMYRRTKDCTAMIVYNDEVAGYYMEFLADRGLSVPEDVLANYAKDILKNKQTLQNIIDRAVEEKLAGWLKEQVELDVKKVTVDEFNKLFEE